MNAVSVRKGWHGRRPRCRRRLSVVAVALATLAAGCEVRDETVRPDAAPGRWPLAALDSAARLDGGRTGAGPAPGIEYVEGYEAASRRAATSRMPIMLVFRAAWCRWSGEISQGPLADPGLVTLSRRFACATVDADRDADTCRDFSVTGFPTVIVLDTDGRERFRATGAAAAAGLPAAMSDVLASLDRPQRLATGPVPRGPVDSGPAAREPGRTGDPDGTPPRASGTGADADAVP